MSDYRRFVHAFWYSGWRAVCRVVGVTIFGIRCFHRNNIPARGGALLACNHQSFLDPMIAALGLPREVHYMARDSLFRKLAFNRLIRSLNAFPVKRNTADLSAIKEALRRLKAGQLLLLFGEGTRTHDGRIAPLQPGMAMIARKAKVPIVPVVIDGAFEAWPRSQKFCRPAAIRVIYGKPITVEQIDSLSGKDAAAIIYQRQQNIQNDLRRRFDREPYTYPADQVHS